MRTLGRPPDRSNIAIPTMFRFSRETYTITRAGRKGEFAASHEGIMTLSVCLRRGPARPILRARRANRHVEPCNLRKADQMHIQQNFIAGILTLLPLAAVWFVLKLIIDALSYFGSPWVSWTATTLGPLFPATIASLLASEAFLYVIGTVFALGVIYVTGMLASRVVGQQLLEAFEGMLARVPFVHMIYSSTKKVISVLQTKQENTQRVVLIDFPNAEMRAIGFAMRTFHETTTGQELTAVFVPTAPNPTSGYLEIVPSANVIPVDLTPDQAMAMIVSGGVVGPDRITFLHKPAPPPATAHS